jgi:hypothetical protein
MMDRVARGSCKKMKKPINEPKIFLSMPNAVFSFFLEE